MRIGSKTFDFKKPVIMGILNVTPDSFSDGGMHFGHDVAVARAMQIIEEGADIIDIGGESSRPGAEPVSVEEELSRVITVISAVRMRSDIPISVDTVKSKVASVALESGADMVNDISSGLFDREMFKVVAGFKVPISLMHMRGVPRTMQTGNIHYDDLMGEIRGFLEARVKEAVDAGIGRDNIMIDPGIGFGKTLEHNITILSELAELKHLGLPVVIGTSRKSFIGKILGNFSPKERLEGSLATVAVAYNNGADIFRVHDVAATRKFLTVLSQF